MPVIAFLIGQGKACELGGVIHHCCNDAVESPIILGGGQRQTNRTR